MVLNVKLKKSGLKTGKVQGIGVNLSTSGIFILKLQDLIVDFYFGGFWLETFAV